MVPLDFCTKCVYHPLKDKYKCKKTLIWGFYGGLMVKNPPCNAWDMGLIPGLGTKITHAKGKVSPCAATTEACVPQLKSLCASAKDSTRCNEDPVCPTKPPNK